MTKDQLIDEYRRLLRDFEADTTELVVAYLEEHPEQNLRALAKELDPENWNALRQRLERARASRKANPEAKIASSRAASVRHARSVLRSAPLEQVEQLVSDLPEDRRRAIAASAGDAYAKARQDYDEAERNLSPAERSAREAAGDALTESVRKAGGGFAALGIAGHIEQATEELHELVADSSLTPAAWEPIARAIDELLEEARVAAAMVNLDTDWERVGR